MKRQPFWRRWKQRLISELAGAVAAEIAREQHNRQLKAMANRKPHDLNPLLASVACAEAETIAGLSRR